MVLLRPAIRQHFGEKRIRAEEVPDFCMDILGITPHSEDEKALLERIQSIHKLLEIQSHSR